MVFFHTSRRWFLPPTAPAIHGRRRYSWIEGISITNVNTYILLLSHHPAPVVTPASFRNAYHQRNTKDGKR